MSKGLEALENICNQCEFYQFERGLRPKKCPFNKSCVYKEQIKKELKALELLKKNLVIAFEEDNGIDLPNLVVGIKTSKNKLCVIYSTQDKEEIRILQEVLL